MSVAALAALGYLIGRSHPLHETTAVDSMLVAASSPGAAVALVFGALVLGALCLRQLTLLWLAWRPGSIHVSDFTAGCTLTGATAEQLTMEFRRRLATLQLQSPTPVPGAPPASDFLDVLDDGRAESRNILGTLVSLMRAAKPSYAYAVRGVLLERDDRFSQGVAIEVVRLPSEGVAATTVWDETWERALHRAADEATAAILPQTRACRAPWGVWRGHVMPAELVHVYEEAVLLERERRYDEALERYYDALKADPMNMVLRLRLGQLQERLGLFLDAFATYVGMCATDKPAGVRQPRVMYRGTGRRERRRALLSARYRRNVLLGGRVLAEQWRRLPEDPDRPTERELQRKRLRQCLRSHITSDLEPFHRATPLSTLLDEPKSDDKKLFRELREVLADYALSDSRSLRWRVRRRLFDRRSTLTPATVRLTEECIRVRLAFVRSRGDQSVSWPPTPQELDKRVNSIEQGWIRVLGISRSFGRWHEHFNAACVYALPLLDDIEADVATALAKRSVQRLKRATARADSAFIASRRDWLLSEDPDLMGLRAHEEFAEFEVLHLPSSAITPRRPRDVQQLEGTRYVQQLLVTAARQWQELWRTRRTNLDEAPALQLVLDWLGDELRAWHDVRAVARHYRHSGSRLRLIHNLQEGARRYGRPSPAIGFPPYELQPLDGALARASCDAAARGEISAGHERLEHLGTILGDDRSDKCERMLADLESWRTTLRHEDAAARRAPLVPIRRLCDEHAALWKLLELWTEADESGAANAERDFAAQVKQTRVLWRSTFLASAPSSGRSRSHAGTDTRVAPLGLVRSTALAALTNAWVALPLAFKQALRDG
ncbi:MAG: hypothetical protein ACXVII_26490 [Solirubrobacteraceae bacterium]